MIVRFLNEKDIENVLSLESESIFQVSDTLDCSEYVLGVFDKNNFLVGFCSVGGADVIDSEYISDILLSDLYIAKESRRKGYGTHLIQEAIAYARSNNSNLLLQPWDDNLTQFYKSFGFETLKDNENLMILYLK